MSKSIRKILGEAYEFVGLSPNGVLTGKQVVKGLQFANEVLQTYNESCLFPFTFATVTGRVSGGHAIIANNDDADFKGEVPANISAVYLRQSIRNSANCPSANSRTSSRSAIMAAHHNGTHSCFPETKREKSTLMPSAIMK